MGLTLIVNCSAALSYPLNILFRRPAEAEILKIVDGIVVKLDGKNIPRAILDIKETMANSFK